MLVDEIDSFNSIDLLYHIISDIFRGDFVPQAIGSLKRAKEEDSLQCLDGFPGLRLLSYFNSPLPKFQRKVLFVLRLEIETGLIELHHQLLSLLHLGLYNGVETKHPSPEVEVLGSVACLVEFDVEPSLKFDPSPVRVKFIRVATFELEVGP